VGNRVKRDEQSPATKHLFLPVKSRAMRSSSLALLLILATPFITAQMKVSNLDGPVTKSETASLLAYISAMQPAPSNKSNAWSYGTSGQAVRALALIYQINPDPQFIDQMVRFCDDELAERNDLAPKPTGQHIIWTGRIDPVWATSLSKDPLSTGGEQGDMVGNLGNCAVTILHTRSLWNTAVEAGDPHHFGATYLDRAETYVRQADFAVDHHILNGLLDLSHDNHQCFAAGSPYKGVTSGSTAHTAPTDKVKDGFLFLAEFRPDVYKEIVSHAVTVGTEASASEGSTSGDIDLFARFLWAKYRRNLQTR
jgi:hypothetical protein